MSNSTPSKNLTESNDKSQNRITRNLEQMTAAFPECPLCKSGAKFKITGMLKNIAACEGCGAGWASHEFYADSPLISLALAKKGSSKEIKPLLNQFRSVEYWKHIDPKAIDIDRIENLLTIYTGPDPEKQVLAKQELDHSDELGVVEVRDIASGLQSSPNRLSALLYLASLKNENDLPLFIQALYDDEGKYSWELVNVFFKLAKEAGFDQAIPPIIQVLEEYQDPALRAYAAELLGEIKGDPRVITALAEALFDNEHFAQEQIMAGSWNSLLVAAAKAKPLQVVREFALRSLINIGDPAAAEALVKVHLDGSFGSNIEKDAENLRPFGAVALDLVIKGLTDENQRVRARAAGFLCILGNENAVQPLIDSLSDEIVLVRSNAAYALGMIGDPRAIEPIKQLRDDPEDKVKQTAELALEKLYIED